MNFYVCQGEPPEAIKILSEEEFESLVELKQAANTLFSKQKFSEAAVKYQSVLDMFDDKQHTETHLLEIVKIYSNLAQCHIQLEEWSQARASATAGLEVCSLPSVIVDHALEQKLRHRRARAAEEIGGHLLEQAAEDCCWILEKGNNTDTEKLLKVIEDQRSSQEHSGCAADGGGTSKDGADRATPGETIKVNRSVDESTGSPLWFQRCGKLRAEEATVFRAAVRVYLDKVYEEADSAGSNEYISLWAELSPYHRLSLVSEVAIGVLCSDEPLPPNTLLHQATFLCIFNFALDLVEAEIESAIDLSRDRDCGRMSDEEQDRLTAEVQRMQRQGHAGTQLDKLRGKQIRKAMKESHKASVEGRDFERDLQSDAQGFMAKFQQLHSGSDESGNHSSPLNYPEP